jgi:Cu-processing system permease protein
MKPIFIVAKNTFREIFRDRILYGLMVFAILLILLSLALGELSYSEQSRITIDFGFTAIHLSAMILSIFVGSTLVSREIEKKTIMTLLVRPISRTQFIVGKSFGLLAVIVMSIVLLAIVLLGIFQVLGQTVSLAFFVGLYGIVLESTLLLAITLFFGSFASPMLAVSFSLGVFLIGHWLDSLKYFTDKSSSLVFVNFGRSVSHIIPNLEFFNWRSLFVYDSAIPYPELLIATVYGLAWSALLIALSTTILRNRDLG